MNTVLDLAVDVARSVRVKLSELVEIVGERRADRAVGVVITPFAAGRRTDFGAAAYQFTAEFLKFLHPRGKFGKDFGVLRQHRLSPRLHDGVDLLVEAIKTCCVFLRCR